MSSEESRGYPGFPWAILLFLIASAILIILVFTIERHKGFIGKLIQASLIGFLAILGFFIMHRTHKHGNVAGTWITFIVLLGLSVLVFFFF